MKERKKAFDIIYKVLVDGAYSNLEIASSLTGFKPNEKAFITRLVYGTISYKIQADYIISKFCSKPTEKLDAQILIVLEMAIYQKLYMDSVPDYAVINESVNLAKVCRKSSASGLVNGVLRSAFAGDIDFSDLKKGSAYYYSIKYSLPKELCMLIMKQYGELAEEIIINSKSLPKFSVRVNTLKDDSLHIPGKICPNIIKYDKGYNVAEDDGFKNGKYYPQDEASALSAYILNPKEDDTVIDMCASPGGKTTYLAQLMNNKGKIFAFDLYEHKIKIINETAKRLGATIIDAKIRDGEKFYEEYELVADKILVDAPCSGYGIIRKKPELCLNISDYSQKELSKIQLNILNNAAKYLKKGGEMVYSTCTINKEENIENIKRFLSDNKDFKLIDISNYLSGHSFKVSGMGWVQILPNEYDMDGFFIAKFKKE